MTEAWGAQISTLSPEAAKHSDEIGQMMNKMLLHTNFIQLSKAAAAAPLIVAGSASSGENAGDKKANGEQATEVDSEDLLYHDPPNNSMDGRVDKRPASESDPPKEKEGKKQKGKTQDEIDADEANNKYALNALCFFFYPQTLHQGDEVKTL